MEAPSVPLRKRRRPALSCVQCRQRKVKCDRNHPCGQCQQFKISLCTYASDPSSAVINERQGAQIVRSGEAVFPTPQSSPRTVFTAEAFQPTATASVQCESNSFSQLESAGATFPALIENKKLRGTLSKTRVFGPSHLMTTFLEFDKIRCYHRHITPSLSTFMQNAQRTEIHTLLRKCKVKARAAKADRQAEWPVNPDFRALVPPQEVCDLLVGLYLKMSECTFRVLHIPSFRKEYSEYWNNPGNESTSFIVKLLLVIAIGTNFNADPVSDARLRSLAPQWIYVAQSWLSGPFEKRRLDINGLQVYCLLLIARQINSVGSELVWISVGSLVRMAIQMGYNRDPKCFPKISVLHGEIRRRLWATILEIAVQTAVDSGMLPLVSFDDFDTEPPSNIDDIEIDDESKSVTPKSMAIFTQTCLQLILFKSLQTRLEIARLINGFRSEPSYEEILRLGSEMTKVCREATNLIQSYESSPQEHRPTAFHRNLVDLLLRRFLLALHIPFAIKARSDPRFYFSRKMAIDTALAILSSEENDDFNRLKVIGGGPFREVPGHAAMILCLELVVQLEEEANDTGYKTQWTKTLREPLIQVVRSMIDLLAKRLLEGENNVQGHLFMSTALGQIEAMERGTSPEQGIFEAAKRSLTECYEVLKARTAPADTGPSPMVDFQDPMDGQSSNGDLLLGSQDFDFDFMQNADLDYGMPNSWLFPGWDGSSWA